MSGKILGQDNLLMKCFSIRSFRLYVLVSLLIVLLAACNSAQESQPTVQVNGESVTRVELQEIVKDIFHKNVGQRKFARWQHTDQEIFCRVIGLRQDRLALFQQIFTRYITETGLKITQCPDQEKGPVTMLYILSDDMDALVSFPLTQSILDADDLKILREKKGIVEKQYDDQSSVDYMVFLTVIAALEKDENLSTQFKKLILTSMFSYILLNNLVQYEDEIILAFIRSYYAIEHTSDLVYTDAIPLISDLMFEQLLNR